MEVKLISIYRTKKGDTPAKIAFRHQVSVEQLLLRNGLSEWMYIEPNMLLDIPAQKKREQKETNWGCLHEYGWRELEADRLQLPSSVSVKEIGTSVLKKPIWSFCIGKGRKKIFFSASWHGNEWLNTWLLMEFLKTLAAKHAEEQMWFGVNICRMLEESTLYFVPLVNPDGVELVQEGVEGIDEERKNILEINGGMKNFRHWSANAAGVDLNHQWPAGWKEEAGSSPKRPFPRHFGGEAPLSEPESRSIYQFSMEENFSHIVALHSQGEEIYWGYRGQEPEESEELAERLAKASSFQSVKTADSNAGYKDWFIKTFRRPGFTVETGTGTNPLPMEASARIWVTGAPLLLESCTFPDFS